MYQFVDLKNLKQIIDLYTPSWDKCSVLIRYAVRIAALQQTHAKKGVNPKTWELSNPKM